MNPFPIRTIPVLFAAAALALALVPATHAEVTRTQGAPSQRPSGQLRIAPGRYEAEVRPGERSTFEVTLTNDSEDSFDVTVTSTDVGAPKNPRSVASKVREGEFGLGDWLTPEIRDIRLAPFETIRFDVAIDAPANAPVGTNLGGLVVDGTIAEGEVGTDDSDGTFRIEGLLQVFLTVPGAVKHDLRVTDVDVRDTFVLGSNRVAVWEVTYENRGTVNEHVTGDFDVRSIFGNSAHRERVRDLVVLRGAKRTQRFVWRDLPWVGAFTPRVRVHGDDDRTIERFGERIVVLSWWLPALIAALLVGPMLWLWWQRRREWRRYLDEDHDLDLA